MEPDTFVAGMVALGASLGGALSTIVLSLANNRRTRPIVQGVMDEHLQPVQLELERIKDEVRHLRELRELDRESAKHLRTEFDEHVAREEAS